MTEGGRSEGVGAKAKRAYYILLVDDDPVVREITEARLTDFGFRVISAVNGLHATQRLKAATDPIDLIITDLSMPGQNGLDFITNIKSSPEYKNIPVIALTGNLDIEVLKTAKLKGAQDVILKPVAFQALLERIYQNL
jgi:CheY-like chemotaxis protein